MDTELFSIVRQFDMAIEKASKCHLGTNNGACVSCLTFVMQDAIAMRKAIKVNGLED